MLFQNSLGIDIKADGISIVHLKSSFKGVRMAAHAAYPLENDRPFKKKLETVSGFIRDFIEENKVTSPNVFFGIPRDLVLLRDIEFPLAVKENLRSTLNYEIEKYIPVSADDIYFDYHILSEDKGNNRLKVLLVAVQKNAIEPYWELKNRLKEGTSGIEINSTAMANYLSYVKGKSDKKTYALIYSEAKNLEFSLFTNSLLNYSRITEVPDQYEHFSSLVLGQLKALRETLKNDPNRLEVILCGRELEGRLFQDLKAEENLEVRTLDLSGAEIPSYDMAPAFGLALKGLQKVPMQINLLPAGLRKKPSRAGLYLMFVLLGLVIVSGLSWTGGHFIRQRFTVKHLNTEMNRLRSEISDIDHMEAKSKELEEQIGFLNAIQNGRVYALDVLKEFTQIIPDTAWVRELTLSDKGVRLDGFAESASDLIPLLEESPLFRNVVFLSAITKGKDGKERFRIGLETVSPK